MVSIAVEYGSEKIMLKKLSYGSKRWWLTKAFDEFPYAKKISGFWTKREALIALFDLASGGGHQKSSIQKADCKDCGDPTELFCSECKKPTCINCLQDGERCDLCSLENSWFVEESYHEPDVFGSTDSKQE